MPHILLLLIEYFDCVFIFMVFPSLQKKTGKTELWNLYYQLAAAFSQKAGSFVSAQKIIQHFLLMSGEQLGNLLLLFRLRESLYYDC